MLTFYLYVVLLRSPHVSYSQSILLFYDGLMVENFINGEYFSNRRMHMKRLKRVTFLAQLTKLDQIIKI